MANAVAKREPRNMRGWDPFQALRNEFDGLWSNLTKDREATLLGSVNVPPIDLSETDDTVQVRMDLPGMKPEEIDIQLNNQVLTISGQRQEEKGETFHRIERRSGSFSRSVALPTTVAEDKVDAQCKDGVLTIVMPKTAEAKSRRIQVKS